MGVMFECFKNKKILITGDTGFKGSWLATWLSKIGANVVGISLKPDENNMHWLKLSNNYETYHIDIRDKLKIRNALNNIQPEFVFHLAAQSLVKESYYSPVETWETNVIGTANLMYELSQIYTLKGLLVVTSDKCYENRESYHPYKETDKLGGFDPYSSSKAATEIVTQSFTKCFFSDKVPIATARAGNVIGGGDWSENRLMPDIFKSLKFKTNLAIRNINAIRPWQHVLDCLYGYLLLAEKLFNGEKSFASQWNFGPNQNIFLKVKDILDLVNNKIDNNIKIELEESPQHEAQLLMLNSEKSNTKLNWYPLLSTEESINLTVDWYLEYLKFDKISTHIQIDEYVKRLNR